MKVQTSINSTSDLEQQVWNNYLKEANHFLRNGTPKGPNAKPINQVNHVGANLVKMRAIKVAAAAIVLNSQKSRKVLGVKGTQISDPEKFIASM